MGQLFGRERELALWADVRERTAAGRGGTLAFSGRAGIGKTALVDHVATEATAAGWRVLTARNVPLNASLPGTVLWQWFAQLVRSTPEGQEPFDGPGGLVRRLVLRTEHAADAGALAFATAWALRSLAATGPVVCVVDDAQWCDQLSHDVVATLPGLVADEAVLLVLGVRDEPGDPAPDAVRDLLDRLGPTRSTLQPLKHRDLTAWLGEAGVPAPREAASRVQIASAGVPYFVEELVAGLADRLDEPASDDAGESLGQESAQALLVDRVHRLSDRDRDVLRAVTLLGEQAVDEHLVALTGHDADALAAAFTSLRAQRLLGAGYPPRLSHALVGAAALDGLTERRRAALHGEIARVLDTAGEHRSVVAGHLLRTTPDDDPDVARALAEAATEAVALGSPGTAVGLLERALRQHDLSYDHRAEMVELLGRAHLLAGDAAAAAGAWRRDLATLDVASRVERLVDVGDALFSAGDVAAASESFGEARTLLEDGAALGEDVEARVLGRLFGAGFLGGSGLAQRHDRLSRILAQDPRADRAGDRALLAQESMRMVMAGEPASTAGDLATRALRGRHLMHEEGSGGSMFAMAASTLMHVDRDADSIAALDAGLDRARRHGSVLEHATLAYSRGLVHHRRGRLRLAQADLESALAARELGWNTFVDVAAGVLVLVHVARGEQEAAREVLEQIPLAAPRPAFFAAVVREAHARVALTDGDAERALTLLAEAVELTESFRGPAFSSWRRTGIVVAAELGRDALARSWAEEELRAAEAFGADRLRAVARVSAARVQPFERAVPMLREAIVLLGRVESRLLLAQTHHDLAVLLLDHAEDQPARRAEGVELARRGLALADQVGAAPLAGGLADLLAGQLDGEAEVERSASLVDRLSPSELTVCELAVQGLTNRQVAEHLFVTVKAVEWHLSRAYAKLGISSRRDLAPHLRGSAELA